MPKHGKVDPTGNPHVGGNTWAGGTGMNRPFDILDSETWNVDMLYLQSCEIVNSMNDMFLIINNYKLNIRFGI